MGKLKQILYEIGLGRPIGWVLYDYCKHPEISIGRYIKQNPDDRDQVMALVSEKYPDKPFDMIKAKRMSTLLSSKKPTKKEKVVNLYKVGHSPEKIAIETNCTIQYVYQVLREAGIKMRRKRSLPEEKKREIIDLYNKKYLIKHISFITKVSPITIKKILIENGLIG